jgi:hypothetical protein
VEKKLKLAVWDGVQKTKSKPRKEAKKEQNLEERCDGCKQPSKSLKEYKNHYYCHTCYPGKDDLKEDNSFVQGIYDEIKEELEKE